MPGFAPDPAVPLVRAVLRVAEREGAAEAALPALSMALFRAGRRGEAVRLAEKALRESQRKDFQQRYAK